MRIANGKKVKLWLLSCLVFLTAVFCAVFGVKFFNPVLTSAEEVTTNRTLLSGEYQTNGASMRIFKKTSSGNLETISATEQGIRFHVEMGSGYKYGTTTLFDETNKNERGSWTIADGFTTYTLVLPKRLMGDATDLTPTTDKVMKLNTTDYWFTDKNGNIESIAYIYNIPAAYRTDTFVFKGIICDENGEVIAETETAERCLAFIAKMSYKDTINPDTVMWGTEEKPLDDVAAVALKAFVPTYTINYAMTNGETQTEEVLWGEKPANIPAFDIPENEHIDYTQSWFDQDRKEEFNIKAAMEWAENKTFNLAQASATEFNLTGVADYNNFVIDSIGYSGAKLYATLDPNQLYTEDERNNGTDRMVEVAAKAENFTYEGNGSFNGIDGVWALLEGQGGNAQMRLIVAFDSSSMVNGDKIVIEEGTAFYANGLMYVLSQEYTIDYAEVDSVEDYGVFLGYLHNSDIKNVKNWIEPTDQTRKRIRVEFRKDVFINSDFKIVYDGELPSGYEYPLYVHCEQGGGLTPITQGFYYWNNGQHTILELEGFGHHGDEMLYGVPGLKIVQNNGYFIYEDAIKWENDGSGNWVEGTEKGTFGANSFEIIGSHASDTTEVRFTTNGNTTLTAGGTTNRWFNGTPTLNVENMSESEPYAVFVTKPDGTVMPLEKFKYHGQDIDAGYHHILGFTGYEGTVAGETITILGGSRFWFESEYYTASETIIFYFNGTSWVVNTDGTANQMITMDDFLGKNYNFQEGGVNKLRMLLVEDANLFNGGNGALILESGSVKVNGRAYTNLRYYGQYIDSNDGSTKYHMIFEIIGDKLAPIGQTAFVDTLVIEAGTKIWIGVDKEASTQPYCIEFSETLEWRYVGEGMRDGGGNPYDYDWIRTDNNTNLDHTSILSMYDATDAGGEVRMNLAAGTLTDNFYGYMAMDTSKGVPVVNGIEMPDEAFSYSSGNQLFAVRGGEYGYALESYIIIPEGSVWWTTQGSFTFVETIYGVVRSLKENGTGNWTTGFNTLTSLGDISATDFMGAENYTETLQDGTVLYKEIRARISREYSNTYYGATAIIGEAVVEKANGTQAKALFGQWYSGTAYDKDHSLVSFRGDAMIDVTDGDVFTIKAGTKLVLGGLGYHMLSEDVVYTYHNGSWQVGDLHATVTYNGTNATVSGTTEALQGDTCTFTVTPNSGYAVTSVTVNGNSLAITENNEYSFTAISGENKVDVTAKKLYAVTWSNPTGATISVSANGSAVANGATVVEGTVLTVNATAAVSHNVTGITANGAAVTNGGTYTVTGATTIAATTAIKTYTVTANCSGGVSVDATSKTVQHGNSVTFTLSAPANATIKANGTVINGNTYTVSNVTGDTTVTFTTWYNVTMNAGNSTVSGDAAGLYQYGDTFDFTVADTLSHNVTGVTSNGSSIGTAAGSYSVKVNGATTIAVAMAEKTKYTVSWTNPTGATIAVSANETGTVTNGGQVYVGQTLTVTATANSGYVVTNVMANGVSIGTTSGTYTVDGATVITLETKKTYTVTAVTSGGVSVDAASKTVIEGESVTFTLTVPTDATIKANGTEINGNTYTVNNVTANTTVTFTTWYTVSVTSLSNASVTVDDVSRAKGWSELRESGTTIKVQASYTQNNSRSLKVGSNSWSDTSAHTVTISGKTEISASSSAVCIVEGTMILMADGTQKAVEDLQAGDMLLVFNHYTGKYDARPLAVNAHADDPATLYQILNVNFSNGAQWRIAGTHGIFDMTLNEYVMISAENINEFAGHQFYYTDGVNGEAVTLISYYVTEEVVKIYSPATVEFANYFANGLLNAPPFPDTYTAGQMNYFDFDENMQYVNVEADIEKYGLYTYEDFADYISEDVFNALPFKYFKISVEKGIMTWDEIMAVIKMLWE